MERFIRLMAAVRWLFVTTVRTVHFLQPEM